MKKILLSITLSLFALMQLHAQNGVAISTSSTATPHASAILDVQSTTQGMLIPRIDIADLSTAAPVSSPDTSLMVYNTNATTGPGFFYWDGTSWVSLTGAKSINDLTDGKTLYPVGSVYLGENAGLANVVGGSSWAAKYNVVMGVNAFKTTTGGHESVAIGYKALELGTRSVRNTAVGYLALQNNSGGGNTAIGAQALVNDTTGYQNTALGNFSLNDMTSGKRNTSLGFDSGRHLATGDENIFIGSNSGEAQTEGDRNIAIGFSVALANTSGDNQMNIGDAIYATGVYRDTAKVGIGKGNNAPNSTLDVGGSVSFPIDNGGTDTLTDADYTYLANGGDVTLPNASGIAGRVYIIKNATSPTDTIIVRTTSNQHIDENYTDTLFNQWDYVQVQSTGSNWIIIGKN